MLEPTYLIIENSLILLEKGGNGEQGKDSRLCSPISSTSALSLQPLESFTAKSDGKPEKGDYVNGQMENVCHPRWERS